MFIEMEAEMLLNDTTTRRAGRMVRHGDRDWDAARRTFNLLVDQRPNGIAVPANAREVADAVAYAREHDLRVAAQATGHNASPLGSLDGTLIVNTSALSGVSIDRGKRTVRVGAGTRWGAVTPRLSDLGLAALHGSSPNVGVVGYSLGGGIGWLARKHGMQANAVTAIELVTADGELVRVDAEAAPELFWALRGGNGNFGVVTAIEFSAFPVRELYAGAMFFEVDRISDVLHAWTELLPTLPEEITSWASVIHFPPFPSISEAVRGRSFMIVLATFLGPEAEGRELLRPMRALGPEMDTFAVQPPAGISELAMDPPDPLPFRMTHALLGDLPSGAIDVVADVAGPGSALALVEFRHMGGALARHEPGAGARATLPGEICMLGLGVVPDADTDPVVVSELGVLSAAVAPNRVGDYPNFIDQPTDASAFFDADTWRRLREVKAQYDPDDVFKGNHHIPPA
jgi:FAD binding domain/Berberine and berberine like